MGQGNRKKSFLELARGAMLERFDYEAGKVMDNILDPNAPARKPRKVTVTVTFLPGEDRLQASYEVVAKSTLQPTNPITGSVAIIAKDGVVSLVEMVPQVPGQLAVGGDEQREPDVIQFPSKHA